jgi:hypothetical protein
MFNNKKRGHQNCPFESSFTHNCAAHSGNPKFPQFTCRHHDGLISRHSTSISVSTSSFSRWASHDIFLFKCHFLLHIWRFLFFFRITLWPIWLANSKRQPCFIHHSHTHKKTHRTNKKKKTDTPAGKPVLCQRTFSSVFRAVFFTQFNWQCMGSLIVKYCMRRS